MIVATPMNDVELAATFRRLAESPDGWRKSYGAPIAR